jgi:hypothetical protein
VVNEAEAVGPKVIVGDKYGKNYDYEDAKTGLALSIRVTSMAMAEGGPDIEEHFCYACMWETLRHLMIERSPMVVQHVSEPRKVVDTDFTYVDGALFKRVVPMEQVDERSRSQSADTQLSELYSEGQLSETSPDEPADDPGLVTKDGEPTAANVDEGPAAASWAALTGTGARSREQQEELVRGWRHQSQIRFRDNAQPKLPDHYGG